MDTQIRSLTTRLKRAGIAFLFVLLVGMIGYYFLSEDASLFDGLYMTFLTVTTIGFSEVINLEGNTLGRIFTIVVAISGIGILTYSFTNLAALIIESDFRKHLKNKKMQQAIANMNNHYLVCGASKLGIHIAEELNNTKRAFLICDIDEEVLEELEELFQYGMVIRGDCTEEGFLEKMNIQQAKGVFVTTRNDHHNIVIVVTARQLVPGIRIVAECIDPENHKKLLRVGADKVISPSYIGGLRMASEMVRPTVTTFLDEMLRDTNHNFRIEEVMVSEKYTGKSVGELAIDEYPDTLLLAIREGVSWKYNPPKDYRIKSGSNLIVMTSPDELKLLRGKY